jgi:hypothetical protein
MLPLHLLQGQYDSVVRFTSRVGGIVKAGEADPIPGSEDYRPLDEVFQLPDVTRPVIALQLSQFFIGYPLQGHALLSPESIEEMVGEKGDVILSLPEGRYGNREDVDAVVEIFSECTLFDLCTEILMGGGNHPET